MITFGSLNMIIELLQIDMLRSGKGMMVFLDAVLCEGIVSCSAWFSDVNSRVCALPT